MTSRWPGGNPGSGPGGSRPAPARVGNPQRRRTSGWVIAALSALGVLAAIALVAGLIVNQQPDKHSVPSLVSKTRDEADKLLRDNNLVPQANAVPGADCTLNVVLRQGTAPSTRARPRFRPWSA